MSLKSQLLINAFMAMHSAGLSSHRSGYLELEDDEIFDFDNDPPVKKIVFTKEEIEHMDSLPKKERKAYIKDLKNKYREGR